MVHRSGEELSEINLEAELKVRDFLKDTLKEIMHILKAECGSLFVFDARAKELVLDAFYNTKQITVSGIRFRVGEGVTGKVIAAKTAVLVKDINSDRRFHKNGFKHYHTDSFISLPLVSPGAELGVINLADKANGEAFTEQDLEYAKTLVEYAGIIAYNLCIAEKLRREKEALDKQKMMLEKYASVGKLAAGVVHEVNNPLDGIIRFTNMLLNQIEHNSVAREYLLEIKRGLNRIENITKSLLQFSHQVNQSASKVKTYVDLHDLIEESLDVFSERMNGSVDVIRNFTAYRPKILDIGLSHVFINIIKNALDAMPKNGRLEISTDIRETDVRVSFKDNGIGMTNEVKARVFDAFFTTKAIDQGTGLGLSICREIINRYDGTIEVESAPGVGSVFHITVPKTYLDHV